MTERPDPTSPDPTSPQPTSPRPTSPDPGKPRIAPLSPQAHAALLVAGNLLPSLCLMILLADRSVEPSWQSGHLHAYASFLLSGRTLIAFYPLLLVAIACFTFSLYRPEQAARWFIVRGGVYTGIVLGLQYSLVLGLTILRVEDLRQWQTLLAIVIGLPSIVLLAVAVPWVSWWLVGWIRRGLSRIGGSTWWLAFVMLAAPLCALALGWLGSSAGESVWGLVLGVPVLLIIGTPYWMLGVYVAMSARLIRQRRRRFQIRLAHLLAMFVWLSAFLGAWRYAVLESLEAYAALPTEPPSNCYIATAAAAGHPAIVGSQVVAAATGGPLRANMQLAYFKCGELLLRTTCPGLHRQLRRLYDGVGPRLAGCLTHPCAADAAYFALKPLEWLLRLLLRCSLGDVTRRAAALYGISLGAGFRG